MRRKKPIDQIFDEQESATGREVTMKRVLFGFFLSMEYVIW